METPNQSSEEFKGQIARLEREAAREQGLRVAQRPLARKLVSAVRKRLPLKSSLRKTAKSVANSVAPSPYERLQQRRDANEKRIGGLDAIEAAAIPAQDLPSEPMTVTLTRKILPAFYHQQFGGKTQAELLEMRNWSRSEIPSKFTVRQWRQHVGEQLMEWATEAMKPKTLRAQAGQGRAGPSATERARDVIDPDGGTPAKSQQDAAKVELENVEQTSNQSDSVGGNRHRSPNPEHPSHRWLSESDLELIMKRRVDPVQSRGLKRRYAAIHNRNEHPDTGEPIDFETERKRAVKQSTPRDVEAIQSSDSSESYDASEVEPSRGSTAMDALQLGIDGLGIVDPTGAADGINAAISGIRMFTDPQRREEHLQNAAISAVSMVPYIGDTA